MSTWYFNPVGGYGLVAASAAVLLMVMMLSSRELRQMRPARRRVLVGLRVEVFLLVIAAMLRPTHVYTESRQKPATLVVLVDQSKSMQTTDAFGDRSRWAVLRDLLNDAVPLLTSMGENLEVKLYAFDRELTPLDLSSDQMSLAETPEGTESAIGAALEEVVRRESAKRLAGVILLSDGAQQAYAPRDLQPQVPARRINDLPAPLFTVTFGQDRTASQARDVALTDLIVSPTVFVKNELNVAGSGRIFGLVNQPIALQVLFESPSGKMEPVAATTLVAKQNGEQVKFDLTYVPQAPGERKLTVRAVPPAGEPITTNNELSTFVNVLDGGINVLYLEGEPRVEQRFLRRSLASSPNIHVDFVWFDKRDRSRWPVDLADRFAPGKYNVYVIGDLDSSVFREEDLRRLRDAVSNGAGLLMLGGFHSFWAGGYQRTPLAEVLPLAVRPVDNLARQDFDAKIREDLHLVPQPAGPSGQKGIAMLPDARFGYEPPMRLAGRDRNREAWEKLPPLEGANRFEALKPAARPLAVTPDGKPLLVAGDFGGGRVLAFAGDSTWRWWMHGFEREHRRFWRQVMLWLARKEDTGDQAVWLELAQRRFPPGARIEFTCGARNAEGEPVDGATFEAFLILLDGSRKPIPISRQGDRYVGTIRDVVQPGDYALEVLGTQAQGALGQARARFTVFEQNLELENAAARPDLMASLARITAPSGGQAISPEQFSDLLQTIKNRPRDREVETETRYTPWDSAPFFLFVVGLLCVEWYLRKRWGWV